MYSFIFRFTLGVFAAVGLARTAKVFREPKEKRDERLLNFFWFFFFLTLHQFVWSIPFTFFKSSGSVTLWSYGVAMVCYFLLLYFGVKTLFYLFPENKFLNKGLLEDIIVLLGSAALLSEVFNFIPPVIENNFVIWQSNPLISWVSGLLGFFTGVIWTVMLYRHMPQNNRFSATMLSWGSLSLGMSCLVFFVVKTPTASMLTFMLIILGLFLGITSFFWPKKTT